MPLARRASRKQRSFDLPVSYKIGESRERLRDALNVCSIQGRLETRFGRSRFNPTSLAGEVKSLSFFKHANGTRYLIAKIGTTLVSVSNSGAHTTIKTGLSADTKHRGITWARGLSSRHIISIENDGLFQFDGTNFTQLGQEPPAAPVLATATGTLPNATYQVYITFYSSVTGFESNASLPTAKITTTAEGLGISGMVTTAANATIDKKCIYLKDVASPDDPIFVAEIDLATAAYEIAELPVSTETYPFSNAKPLSGGGKYFTEFNRKLVYAGNNTYKNDVFFSEQDLPDAFNDGAGPDRLVLNPIYDGHVTGIATGLYNNSVLDPYLVIFKERSTHIYSEIGGEPKLIPISQEIGCVSHDTIKVKNGNVYFLSTSGWRVIENGRLVLGGNGNNSKDNPVTLGMGDLDDIFTSPGYVYEANKSRLNDAFSVYYSTLDQYFTWVAEGAENDFTKAYVYEYKIGGFKPYSFHSAATCACIGEDTNGKEVVFMGDDAGYVFTHSINESRADQDMNGDLKDITSFAQMTWQDGDDMDASFNFRELILKRVAGNDVMNVKAWVNYSLDESASYEFDSPRTGFILDVSKVDQDSFGSDDRTLITARSDVNRTGENIMIGFYQQGQDVSLGLVAAQLEMSRNGNRNR